MLCLQKTLLPSGYLVEALEEILLSMLHKYTHVDAQMCVQIPVCKQMNLVHMKNKSEHNLHKRKSHVNSPL